MKKKLALIIIIGIISIIQPLNAQTWEATKRLTWNSNPSLEPAIAIDLNNHIHLVWNNYTPSYQEEIFYKKSTNGGTNWTTKRLTWNSSFSMYPAIGVDSNNHIHVVWQDGLPPVSWTYRKV